MSGHTEIPSAELVDVNDTLSQYIGSAKDVLCRYTTCSICGARLHFTHLTDFTRNLTQETAKCPECGIKIRRVMHRLQ